MLAIALLAAAPVIVAMAAATILAVTAALTGMRIADHRRQVAAGDALTDEQVEGAGRAAPRLRPAADGVGLTGLVRLLRIEACPPTEPA